MNVMQQLKKRKVIDKKGKFEGYLGQVSFKKNPVVPGFSGIKKDKVHINLIAKEREEKFNKSRFKEIKKKF